MRDRDVLGVVFSFLIGGLCAVIWRMGEVGKPASICVGLVLGGFLWDWWEKPDNGPVRPPLTVLAEVFGIVGGVVALIELIRR
ncbi:hypothetical protein OG350_37560 [Streptomyces achromogenes]|uniref:GlsB/YeaQ/YmgE family stress response membrane protein n=1 Tax=Streptomyces achromogenes TaxID=67255 RepID=A0ABZ1KYH5_STRAH